MIMIDLCKSDELVPWYHSLGQQCNKFLMKLKDGFCFLTLHAPAVTQSTKDRVTGNATIPMHKAHTWLRYL